MKRLITVLSLSLIAATVANARLGENLGQCTQRYGKPIFINTQFRVGTTFIVVEYDKGIVQRIKYKSEAAPYTARDIEAFKAANRDGAMTINSKSNLVTFTSAEWTKAEAAQQQQNASRF
jgi:hypothetical protein